MDSAGGAEGAAVHEAALDTVEGAAGESAAAAGGAAGVDGVGADDAGVEGAADEDAADDDAESFVGIVPIGTPPTRTTADPSDISDSTRRYSKPSVLSLFAK